MATSHTLIIGDDIGGGLYDSLFKIPGTGALWRDIWSNRAIRAWADGNELRAALDQIANPGKGETPPDTLPNVVLISLGRQEIIGETDSSDQKDLTELAKDVGRVVDATKAAKLTPLWILPPQIKGEKGAVRATIEKALADKGVRAFHANQTFNDPSTRGKDAAPISTDTYDKMADLVAAWAPLGTSHAGPVLTYIGDTSPASVGGWWSSLSVPAKLAVGVSGLALLGGAAYAAKRSYG